MSEISIKADYILTMNKNFELIKDGVVHVEGDKISYVGDDSSMFLRSSDKAFDGTGKILLPGFVNAHSHLAITSLKGLAEGLPLIEWLLKGLGPYQNAMDFQDAVIADYVGCCELINSGITCVADFFGFSHIAPVIEKMGLRAVLNFVVMDRLFDDEWGVDSDLREATQTIKHWNQSAEGRIKCSIGPHAPYSCSEELMIACSKIASDLNIGIHLHLAESVEEVEWSRKKFGCTPVELVNRLGLLTPRTIAAHCVQVTKEDIDLLSQSGASVVHCPTSNAKLGCGIAPVKEMVDRNITVSLGTDSSVSNNSLNLFKEMTVASLLQNIKYNRAGVIDSKQMLKMATFNGAKCLGLSQEIGSIETGKKADMILVDYKKAHFSPLNDVYSNMVFSALASDVDVVIINGKVVKDKEILCVNEEEIVRLSEVSAEKIRRNRHHMDFRQ